MSAGGTRTGLTLTRVRPAMRRSGLSGGTKTRLRTVLTPPSFEVAVTSTSCFPGVSSATVVDLLLGAPPSIRVSTLRRPS